MSAGIVTVVSRAPLARLNPVTKLGVAVVLALTLAVTVDVVTAGAVLSCELLMLPLTGLGVRRLAPRLALLLVVGTSVALVNALASDRGGSVVLDVGPLEVGSAAALAGVAAGLRVVAIALPGMVLFATTDPTDLADALAQRLGLPHRFVLGALAAMRLMSVLDEEWRSMARARRARGLVTGGSPLAALRTFPGQTFALLVAAIRRGSRMATAMEVRGLGVHPDRTWARSSDFAAGDVVTSVGVLVLAAGATALALRLGAWDPIFG